MNRIVLVCVCGGGGGGGGDVRKVGLMKMKEMSFCVSAVRQEDG